MLYLKTKEEFRQVFLKELVNSELSLDRYSLRIYKDDFFHACFEKGKGALQKERFGYRRARRLLLIRGVCLGNIPYQLVYQSKRASPTLAVLLPELEFVIYLKGISVEGSFTLKLVTMIHYEKDFSKVWRKHLNAGEKVSTIAEYVELIDAAQQL